MLYYINNGNLCVQRQTPRFPLLDSYILRVAEKTAKRKIFGVFLTKLYNLVTQVKFQGIFFSDSCRGAGQFPKNGTSENKSDYQEATTTGTVEVEVNQGNRTYVEVGKAITSEIKEIDVWFVPNCPEIPTQLGLLGRLCQNATLFEPYRNPVTVDEINNCIFKLLAV